MKLRARDDPEANGRIPQHNDQRWIITIPLEDGEDLVVQMGKKSRDILYGMLIAEDTDDEKEAREHK